MLLLEAVLIREVNLAVEALKADSLAKPKELVVDKAILDVVEFVDSLHNCLTLVLASNLAVNYKGRGGSKGLRCAREGSAASMRRAAENATAHASWWCLLRVWTHK